MALGRASPHRALIRHSYFPFGYLSGYRSFYLRLPSIVNYRAAWRNVRRPGKVAAFLTPDRSPVEKGEISSASTEDLRYPLRDGCFRYYATVSTVERTTSTSTQRIPMLQTDNHRLNREITTRRLRAHRIACSNDQQYQGIFRTSETFQGLPMKRDNGVHVFPERLPVIQAEHVIFS